MRTSHVKIGITKNTRRGSSELMKVVKEVFSPIYYQLCCCLCSVLGEGGEDGDDGFDCC